MKRRILIIAILIVIVISAALLWYFCCGRVGKNLAEQQRRDDNDACVKEALEAYHKALRVLGKQFNLDFNDPADEVIPEEKNLSPERALLFSNIRKSDKTRYNLACHGNYLPFQIANGNIQDYPVTEPPCPLPSPTPSPSPTPTPVPGRIKDNSAKILDLAKSVGRLGIRRLGLESYPAFWGTGFLVASSQTADTAGVIVTTCHLMDPIMKVDGGKHQLDLHGEEELLIDFEGYDNGANYDYQCPIKDVLACSSQEGVDVALLYFEKGQCKGSGALPYGALLDADPPHPTAGSKKPGDPEDCAKATGKNCLAMIAYADIDHPIDAETNDIYGVYQDPKLSDFQFVMNDDVVKVEECEPNVQIMMDVATTTVGESGGVLTYLDRLVDNKLIVSGMHTCCSAFFKYSAETPPASETSCAHLRRTLDNQAISTSSMLKDHDICTVLKDHNALPQGYVCP